MIKSQDRLQKPRWNITPVSALETFSKDGKQLYGIREEGEHLTLFSLDLATRTTRDLRGLGANLAPRTDFSPATRFSVAPDGKSIAYSVADMRSASSLWLLEGCQHPGLLQRLIGPRNPLSAINPQDTKL